MWTRQRRVTLEFRRKLGRVRNSPFYACGSEVLTGQLRAVASYRVSSLGKFLRPFREGRGVSTAKEFGELTGIRRTHLSEIENGRRNLTEKMVVRIANAIGMTSEELKEKLHDLAEAAPSEDVPGNHAEPSPKIREGAELYPRRMTTRVPDTDALLRHLIGKMTREEQFQLLRELTDAGEAGDLTAVPKARALLELIPTQPMTGPAGG